MADTIKKRTFEIEIAGVKESVTNLETLEKVLDKMEKQVDSINKNGGFSVVSKEANKNTKEAIDLAKAEQIAQGEVISSYKEKQKAMSALGKEIKSMTVADSDAAKKQQEMIQQYNGLNDQLKRFDAAMGNHHRNVGDYRGALKEANAELKAMKGEMVGLDQNSERFKELAKQAGATADKIGDINAAIKRQASDTRMLDDAINLAKSATAAFTLYKGAMSALGVETEGVEEAMQKLLGAMSIIQSLQALSESLQSSSATAQLFHKVLQALGIEAKSAATSMDALATAEKGATVATDTLSLSAKALRLVLASLGIGLVIWAVTELVMHWEELCDWFDETIPIAKKVGGVFNWLKAVAFGLGKSIIDFLINPFKTFADVMSKIVQGDFEGAMKAAVSGIARQANVAYSSFKKGYQDQIESGLEEMTKKAAEEQSKQTKYELDMLKARKGNQARFTKEGIALQKKEFEERKKAAKGNVEELRKIAIEEATFYRELEEYKTSQTKKGAAARGKIARQEADNAKQLAKEEEDAAKKVSEANKKLDDAFYKVFQADIKEELRAAELEVEKFAEGPIKKLVDALYVVENLKGEILEGEETKAFNDLWNSLDENYKKVFGSVEKLREQSGYLSLEQLKAQEEIEKSFTGTTKAVKDQIEAFQKGIEEIQTNIQTILKNAETNRNVLARESAIKLAEGFKKTAQAEIKNAENLYKNFLEEIKKIDVEPVRYKFSGLINTEETTKKLEKAKEEWVRIQGEINNEIADTENNWNQLLARLEQIYTKDSQIYKDAVQQKYEALNKLKKLQEEVALRANNPIGLTTIDYNGDNKPEAEKPKRQLWFGKGEKDEKGKEYSFIDNMANLFNSLDEMVLAPAMDTFQMYMDFAIEETERRLEEVEKLHDEALDKVEDSASKIQELNDKLKDAGNTNIEATKQQLADEQLLYAQRLAEERKLADEERMLKNKAAQQEANARKMELRYQMVMAVANTAQGASKALADWGWPLGAVFAGLMAALGAVQTALIAKQIGSIQPVKYADGGLLQGPSHSQGGIKIPNTNVEVEGREFIVNKRSTKKYLPLLEAINAEGRKSFVNTDKRIRKYANGGTLNFDKVDDNLRESNNTNRLLNAIDGIDIQPVVAVKDIWKVEDRLVKVRSLAGK